MFVYAPPYYAPLETCILWTRKRITSEEVREEYLGEEKKIV